MKPRRGDLELLGRFLEAGLPVPIEREVPLSEAAAALAHFARSGARGKVVAQIASH